MRNDIRFLIFMVAVNALLALIIVIRLNRA